MNRSLSFRSKLAVAGAMHPLGLPTANAPDNTDLDVFSEAGLNTAGTTQVSALDLAWNDEGTVDV